MNKSSALASWTPEQVALGKKWDETWQLAAKDLARIRRKEIRELDTLQNHLSSLRVGGSHATTIRAAAMVRPDGTTTMV